MPAVSSRSFTPYGMPCSGPRYLPGGDFRVGLPRLRERDVPRERDDAAQLRIELLDPLQIDVRQPLGGQCLLPRSSATAASPARTRCRRRLRAADQRSVAAADEADRATGPHDRRRRTRDSTASRARRSHRARPCAARRAARAAAPSTAASSPPPSRARPALIVTCASFSASANVAGRDRRAQTGRRPERRRRARRRRRYGTALRCLAAGRRHRAHGRSDQELSAGVHGRSEVRCQIIRGQRPRSEVGGRRSDPASADPGERCPDCSPRNRPRGHRDRGHRQCNDERIGNGPSLVIGQIDVGQADQKKR